MPAAQAEMLLKFVLKKHPRHIYAQIHQAELDIHQSKFERAATRLSQAKYTVLSVYQNEVAEILRHQHLESRAVSQTQLFSNTTSDIRSEVANKKQADTLIKRKSDIRDMHLFKQSVRNQMAVHVNESQVAAIYSLLAAALFRLNPTQPEHR